MHVHVNNNGYYLLCWMINLVLYCCMVGIFAKILINRIGSILGNMIAVMLGTMLGNMLGNMLSSILAG